MPTRQVATPAALGFRALISLLLLGMLASNAVAQSGRYRRWYLAEGASGTFFEEDILIANPNATTANIRITFLRESGAPVEHNLTMLPTSRSTVRVNTIPGLENALAVSAVVECTNNLDIAVERSMYWGGGHKRGGHNSPGVLEPATRWFLAEGATGYFNEFVLIANPGPAAADLRVRFLKEDGSVIERIMTVGPNSRRNIWPNAEIAGLQSAAFSTLVESTNGVGIIVERAMYWLDFEGGHGSAGVTAPSTTWRFAEGFTGRTADGSLEFETYLLLANPGTTAANVRALYFRPSGPPVERFYTVRPTSRLTIHVDAIPELATHAFSTALDVSNNVPIIAERAMYWGRSASAADWIDGHNTPGVTAEATAWAFAEGVDDALFDTYVLVVNSSTTALGLRATFMREDGKGIQKTFTVPAQSRFNIFPGAYAELSNGRFATFLQSTNDVPFVAERAVYWGDGYYGGHASTGTPWTGTIAVPPSPNPPNPPVPVTSTAVSLAFGDSITAGISSDLTSLGTVSLSFFDQTIPYSERLRRLMQERYTTQTIVVENAGRPGEYVVAGGDDGRTRLPRTLKPSHELVIILEGVNDIANNPTNFTVVRDGLRSMALAARAQGKQVFLCTLTPVYSVNGFFPAEPAAINQLNERIRLLSDTGAYIVDLAAAFGNDRSLIGSDGLHPSPAGHQKIADAVFGAIMDRFESLVTPP